MTDANLVLGVDASRMKKGADEGRTSLDKLDKKAQATERALKNTGTGAGRAAKDLRSMANEGQKTERVLGNVARTARNLVSVLAAGFGVREIIRASDAYTTLENRISSVTKSAQEYRSVSRDLFRIAQDTRQDLRNVADLYFRLSGSFSEAQKQAFPLLDITEGLGKAFIVTGVEAQQAQAFILQLSQAAAADFKGVGQEINTLIEAAPALSRAIAQELGLKSATALKQFAESGQLNVNNFFEAMQRAIDGMEGNFEKMNSTVEQSAIRLQNAFTQYVGQSSVVSGATSTLTGFINLLADNFDVLANGALALAGVLAIRLTASLITTGALFVKNTAQAVAYQIALARMAGTSATAAIAMTGLSRAMMFFGGPIGLAIGAITTAIMLLGNETTETGKAQEFSNKVLEENQKLTQKSIGLSDEMRKNLIEEKKALIEKTKAQIDDTLALIEAAKVRAAENFAAQSNFTTARIGQSPATLRALDAQKQLNKSLDVYKGTLGTLKEELQEFESQSKKTASSAGAFTSEVKKITKEGGTARTALQETAQIFRDVATDISNGFTNMFESIFTDGLGAFRDLSGNIADIFRRMLSRLATLAIAQPVIVPIVQSVGGAFGLNSGSIGQVTQQLGLGDAVSAGSSFLGDGSLSGTFLGRGIDSVGNALGLSNGAFIGPMPAGQAAPLSGAFNVASAGAGFAGNMLGNALFGNRGIGADIGGALGSLGGTAVGASMGTILGMAGGPVGAAIGALAGNALGGLFGGNVDSVASNFGGTINAQGGLNNQVIRTNGEGDPETARALSQGVQNIASSLIAAGLDVSGQIIQGGIDDGRGFLGVGSANYLDLRDGRAGAINFDPAGGEAAVNQAMASLAVQLAAVTDTGSQFADSFKRIETNGRDAQAVLNDISFIVNFDRLGEEFMENTQRVTEFETSVKAMRAQFEAAQETTERLGLSVEEFAMRVKAVEADVTRQFNQSVSRQIASAGGFGQLIDEVQRYKDQLREAQLVNGDIQQVELLHQLNMQQLIGDTNRAQVSSLQEQAREASGLVAAYQRVSKTLRDAVNNITVGQFTILSPLDQLNQSQRLFDQAFARAQGGDIDAANSLPGLANTLLSQGQGFFASGTDFARLQRDTVAKLEEAERVAGAQVDIQTRIFQSSEQQIRVLQQGFDSVSNAVSNAAIQQLAAIRGVDGEGFSAGNFNDRIVSLFGSGLTGASSGVQSQIRSIFSQTIGNVQEGGGAVTAAFNANSSANQLAFDLARQFGIPGFANGGTFTGTGLVGERGAEFITTSRQATVVPYQANKEVVQQIRASNDNMRMMANIMQQGFLQTIDKLGEVVDATKEGSRQQRRSGKRKGA